MTAVVLAGTSFGRPVAPHDPLKVAVVNTAGDPDPLALEGLADARARQGVTGKAFLSGSAAGDLGALTAAAQQGYELVLAGSASMADAVALAAAEFPSTKFGVVGAHWGTLASRPANVRGLVFADQESGYLAGAAAALASDAHSVSAIGELRVPASVAFLAGFKAGAQRTVPGTTVRIGTVRAPAGASACRELALRQLDAGSDGIAAASRVCAQAALQAATGRDAWGVGLGTGAARQSRNLLTSVIERSDVAVYETIADVIDGSFEGGGDSVFAIDRGGISVSGVSPRAPATVRARLASITAAIGAGKLKPPRR